VPPAPSPDVSALLSRMEALQSQIQALQSRILESQQRVAISPEVAAELEYLRRERAQLQAQLDQIRQQLVQVARERPRDATPQVIQLLIMQMQEQARANAEMMRMLYEQMLSQRQSTSASEIRDVLYEIQRERDRLMAQVMELQRQLEELRRAPPAPPAPPPAPPAPAWYPGMIIRSILSAFMPRGGMEILSEGENLYPTGSEKYPA